MLVCNDSYLKAHVLLFLDSRQLCNKSSPFDLPRLVHLLLS